MFTFSLTSLGCAKNLVNSEQMCFLLSEAGYRLVSDPDGADLAVINTCGFIDAAKSEAIDCILEHAELKKEGRLGGLIVTGCLPERYQDEIQEELPEIDAVLGVASYGDIVSAAKEVLSHRSYRSFAKDSAAVDEIPRLVSTGPGWAYLRIAEGCNNFCAFCAIPYIRGRYRSRDMDAIVHEAEALAAGGVKELIIIAQDITRYGSDLYQRNCLAELCHRLSLVPEVRWIRLHYLYPDQFSEELINEIAENDKILKYLDIPIQHINNQILKRMNRHGSGDEIRSLFRTLRDRVPGLVIRTSLITGLPGEGESEFEELCAFLQEAHIERAGVFPFSPEEGTPAAEMPHVSEETARQRADLIMELQSRFLDDFAESLVGKMIPVLVESFDTEEQVWIGRSYADSPEIDSYVKVKGDCAPGDMPIVLIEAAENGVLCGKVAEKQC